VKYILLKQHYTPEEMDGVIYRLCESHNEQEERIVALEKDIKELRRHLSGLLRYVSADYRPRVTQ